MDGRELRVSVARYERVIDDRDSGRGRGRLVYICFTLLNHINLFYSSHDNLNGNIVLFVAAIFWIWGTLRNIGLSQVIY